MIILLNAVILVSLLVLLVAEEMRFRMFKKHVLSTRESLRLIAHQLRSPLAGLTKYNTLLRQKALGPLSIAQTESLSKMEMMTSDAIVQMQRLLAASRIEDGDFVPERREIDLRESVTAAVNAMSGFIHERNHSLVLRLGKKKALLRTEPVLLHGILDEIIQNAAVYTPPQGTVTISIQQKLGKWSVSIKDTGIGISAEDKRTIFQKFFRGERARDLYQGNGLGLAFAESFAEKIGARISFVSEVDKGSCFTVQFKKQ